MRVFLRSLVVSSLSSLLFSLGCNIPDVKVNRDMMIPGGDMTLPTGPGVGSTCAKDSECRAGLVCKEATCQVRPVGIPGASCVLSGECLAGNYCALGRCAESGKTAEGGQCSAEGDCMAGFVCNVTGIYGTCVKAGTGDVDKPCTQTSDCRGGLICALGKCQPLWSVKPWVGASCPQLEEPTAKVYFQVPRASDAPTDDYYRLPFPNDIRWKGGKVDLARHPRPGARILPFDPVDVILKSIEEDGTGFGTNPTVFFRFSRTPDLGSFEKAGVVAFYDLTAGTPGYGFRIGHRYEVTTGGGRYICPRFLMVKPPSWGNPLLPGHTYAVIIGKGVTEEPTKGMGVFGRDTDFDAMLAATAPGDADLAAAWKAYDPLRKFLADPKVESKPKADDVIAAAVFTVDNVDEPLAKLRAAVQTASIEVKSMVKCEAGVTSPCAGKSDVGEALGCGAPDPAFDEYQGKITLPGYQKGKVPFEQPTDGGGIEFGAGGMPTVQRSEEVCFSLAVPKGGAPANGWPVVLYGHGTGGSYRSAVESGLAADFANGDVDGGAKFPMATLGYDGVLHGTRKAGSMKPTSELVFNYLNPRAARDNPVQAAVDLFALAKALRGWTGGGVKLDGSKIALYGHSQGGNAGALAAGFESSFNVVVLSGTGGGLIPSILAKKNPVSVAGALPIVLSDGPVDQMHPVLSLLQMYFDRSDPVNFARRIVIAPPMGEKPKNLLHIAGKDDTYAPDGTQDNFGVAAGLPVANPVFEMTNLVKVDKFPVINNLKAGSFPEVTAVQTQYAPSGYDGHFVSTQNPAARKSLRVMIGSYLRDGKAVAQP